MCATWNSAVNCSAGVNACVHCDSGGRADTPSSYNKHSCQYTDERDTEQEQRETAREGQWFAFMSAKSDRCISVINTLACYSGGLGFESLLGNRLS
jgi:hypothetical protein